ncbi:MAG: glycosyltransferase family 87 protein [Planctomycetaceae bacterium]
MMPRNRLFKWFLAHRRPLKICLLMAGCAAYLMQFVRLLLSTDDPPGDFKLHWELARRMLNGEFIYAGGLDCPYPPFWGLAHIPFLMFPTSVAQWVAYPLFAVSLLMLMWTLNRLTRDRIRLDQKTLFWVGAIPVILAVRFLVRDMLECGVNLALVALTWFVVYLWTEHRDRLAGIVLGLAISLKCTPALFLVYFIWKRQWGVVLSTLVAVTAFTFSPICWMGPTEFARAGDFWYRHSIRGLTSEDPTLGVLGQEHFQNISLRSSLGRFLTHIPSGHKSRVDHPLYVDVLTLDPATAERLIQCLLTLLAVLVFSRMKPSVNDRGATSILWECSIISTMTLLYSPITWGQHCVAIIPALYLMTRTALLERTMPTWMAHILAIYVGLVLVLNRAVVGRDLSRLMDSYHLTTWCLLGVLAIVVGYHSHAQQSWRDRKPRYATLNAIFVRR